MFDIFKAPSYDGEILKVLYVGGGKDEKGWDRIDAALKVGYTIKGVAQSNSANFQVLFVLEKIR